MAVGDVQADNQSVADDSFLSIQPASGEEWNVHNIFHAGAVELEWFDGTNLIKFDESDRAGWFSFTSLHVTNSQYVRVKNVSGDAARLGYSGVETKVSS